jgi:hemoglobin
MKRLLCLFIAVGCGKSESGSKEGGKEPPAPTAPAPAAGGDAAPGKKVLFERLGGKPAIEAVVEEFVGRTTTDPRIKHRFHNTDAAELKRLLVEFVCVATGGPCEYTGRDMKTSHAGMDLVDEEFTALVEDLVAALDKFKVPDAEKQELLGALAKLKPDIVVTPDALHPIEAGKLAPAKELAGKLADKQAGDLLAAAVVAGERGQRSYAEQLFTRAELVVGAKALAKVAPVFRAGGPPRMTSALKKLPEDTAAQPTTGVGSSEEDDKDLKPPPGRGSLTGELRMDGKPVSGLGVVMLRPLKGAFKKRTPKQRVIEQRGKQFAPHVMAVPTGSTVSFPNFDPIYHNVFSLSKTRPFDLGMYQKGELREVKFDKPGLVRLSCNIHSNMSAYLIIVDDPHYAVVEEGKFAFHSLAPGKYRVQAWSERGGEPTTSEIDIKAGENQAPIDLSAGQPEPDLDKFGSKRSAAAPAAPPAAP